VVFRELIPIGMDQNIKEQGFSVEMKSKEYVKTFSMNDGGREGVLFEGVLGELVELVVMDEAVLRIQGANGTLRVDMTEDELWLKLRSRTEV